MTSSKSPFDKRVTATLANIATLREISQIMKKGGHFEKQWGEFVIKLFREIKNNNPKLKRWVFEDDYTYAIDFYPTKTWKVIKDDHICFSFNYNYLMNNNMYGNPWIGIYVPAKWKYYETFVNLLSEEIEKLNEYEWDEPSTEWPVWKYIEMTNYSKKSSFDVIRFKQDIKTTVNQLLVFTDAINKLLSQMK